MFATETGKTRTVDEGMWCEKCGTVVQCHVEGTDAELIEQAVRSFYSEYDDRPTVCVCAGQNAVVIIDNHGMNVGIGTGWKEVRAFWREKGGA